MTTSTRTSYAYNRSLQYWVPCIEPEYDPRLHPPGHLSLPLAERIHPSPPTDWPRCVEQLLDLVRLTAVGRAIVSHVRERTTIYQALYGNNGAYLDTYEAWNGNQDRDTAASRAAAGGYAAVIRLDFGATAHHNEHGLLKTPDASLAHELAHAVSMTNAGYSHSFSSSVPRNEAESARFERTSRAPSREEAYAWIIENRYRSEARISIRDSYMQDGATEYALDPSARSTGVPLAVLEHDAVVHFRRHAAAFATELEQLDSERCPYNPIRRLSSERRVRRSGRAGAVDGR